jgi:membrane-bound serine protease (ClpP class)
MNDALAFARSLAELRGRNADFAEAMIRDAESVNSSEALEMGIIEVIARDLDDLLTQIDGMTVEVASGEVDVHSAGLGIERVPMNWVQQLITMITDPNVAFILMNFGFLGILIELYNPGSILPGVVGVICLILALYALSVLPFSATGLALIVVGLLMMGAEIFVVSGGVLAIGGFISFAIGAFFLFDSPVAAFQLDWRVLIGTLVAFAIILFLVITYALSALGRKITSGPEELIGMKGKVVEWTGTEGIVFLDGETWQSRSTGPLEPGQQVVATARDGNFLVVQGA